MRSLAIVTTALAALVPVLADTADHVLVLGHREQLHAVSGKGAAAPFTATGLADLAKGALGLRTGVMETTHAGVITPDAAPDVTPLLPDVFDHVDAYAHVFVAPSEAAMLPRLHVPNDLAVARMFEVDTTKSLDGVAAVPMSVAHDLDLATTTWTCATSDATLCRSHVDVEPAQVEHVVDEYEFLTADMALAQELAHVRQVTAMVAHKAKPHAYVVVSFSSLETFKDSATQAQARDALGLAIESLLTVLATTYPSCGMQLVAAPIVASAPAAAAAQGTTTTRMLLAGSGSGSVGAPVALNNGTLNAAANGTAANATSNTNSTGQHTEVDIAEYQIILWTSVLLVGALATIMVAMCNMNSHRDNLLYAKFTTSSGRKYD